MSNYKSMSCDFCTFDFLPQQIIHETGEVIGLPSQSIYQNKGKSVFFQLNIIKKQFEMLV